MIKMAGVLLAGDLGYGVPWLINILIIAIVTTAGFLIFVSLTTKYKNKEGIKYILVKYHAERYWAIFVAGVLIWFWILGYPWMPPIAFDKTLSSNSKVHLIHITAGQWFWQFKDGGIIDDKNYKENNFKNVKSSSISNNNHPISKNQDITSPSSSGLIKIKAGETVKFVANSIDVNHGFGVLTSSKSMDSPLMQMQVVPGFDNIFYYTFKAPGTFTIRCLEYCGWNHPYMVSQITVEAV
jgi:heme/copper-type cytochrome/quinol oxidase subunit 2